MTGLMVIVFLSQAGVYDHMTTTQVDFARCIENVDVGTPKAITGKDGKTYMAVGLCIDMRDNSI